MEINKPATTAERLRQIMQERGLKQADILRLCAPLCKQYGVKMGSNDLSQYVTGKIEPGQFKLIVLGQALGVSEAWLMGFDVPRDREAPAGRTGLCDDSLTPHERDVIDAYRAQPDMQPAVDRLLGVPSVPAESPDPAVSLLSELRALEEKTPVSK